MNDLTQNESRRTWALTLGALGIVFGDLATSPLYSLRECFSEHYGIAPTPENILGVLSMIIWSLIIIVFVKYILFVLKADNKGEGGILSLLALAVPMSQFPTGYRRWIIYIGLFGAALLYGDGMITPAISVLSAMEGLKIATPVFEPYVIPITIAILAYLFYFQSSGTSKIGFIFGPIMLIYLFMIAVLGAGQIIYAPAVLWAINPIHAARYFHQNGFSGIWVLGSVFLVLTGCEALYADMGHFGSTPIRRAWGFIVFPSLFINYLGQGALLLQNPAAISNPFYLLAPHWALYPVLIIATLTTVVASQALISGVFSLTRQAIQLGYSPRLQIVHTSSQEIGQIYIPQMNWAVMIATIWLVLEFRTSSALAGAYGIAVSITMLITTLLAMYVAVKIWNWKIWVAVAIGTTFVMIDSVFLGANIIKIPDGGWFPLLIAAIVFTLMTTWKRGRRILAVRMRAQMRSFSDFVQKEMENPIHRIEGTAIYMTSDPEVVPPALARNFRHNQVLHKQVVLLSIMTKEVPRVEINERVEVENFPEGFHRVVCIYGFMEVPNIKEIIEACGVHGLELDMSKITFFLGRETLIAARRHGGMALWREHIFAFMSRNAQRATQFFHIPPEQVMEIGSQIEL